MSIELSKKYLPLLDEKYKWEAKSSILDASGDLVRESESANTIYIPKITTTGLKDYNRNTGFKAGSSTLEWVAHTFTQDRGTSFTIDKYDDIETLGIAFGSLAGQFIREWVAPEIDAYRFSTYASEAGHKVSATPTTSNIVTLIDTANYTMNDDEVTEEGRILFISNESYNLLKQSSALTRFVNVQANNGVVNRNIETFDNMPIIKVPSTRFKTEYVFNDGSTEGQTSGGFTAAEGADDINFMIIHPSALLQIVKTAMPRVFSPEVNQTADAWKFDYRLYHDAFVRDNGVNGIYVHTK